MTSAAKRLAQARDPDYWRALDPAMHVESAACVRAWRPIDVDVSASIDTLRTDGYFDLPDLLPARQRKKILGAILRVRDEGWPPTMAFVYDELWQTPARAAAVIPQILGEGYLQMPDFWAWYIDPDAGDAGWRPHRDKGFDTIAADGMPTSLTTWIPLTDATPLNGCIYALPKSHDPLHGRDYRDVQIREPQKIRALPAKAGTLMCWDQALLHWGAQSSPRAKEPRVSFACEFQRADVGPYNTPLLEPMKPPSFRLRISLIAMQVLQYRHMYPLSAAMDFVAKSVLSRQ